ncbi:MAG: hypothetical protein NZ455_12220 [Bacteroidia bacterium]|nr:hypothetical protein [Bacteroidia bacterium]
MGVSLRCASGRATPHYAIASVLRCASHCLTACSVSLTQFYPGYFHYAQIQLSKFLEAIKKIFWDERCSSFFMTLLMYKDGGTIKKR